MGQKERRHVKEATPSVHSISSSEVSASDVSSDDGSSVHERSTPKIAAIIILGVFIVAILVGVTVYLIDTKRLMIAEEATIVDVVRQLGKDNRTRIGNNESLKQQQQSVTTSTQAPVLIEDVIVEKDTLYDEIILPANVTSFEEDSEQVVENSSNEETDDFVASLDEEMYDNPDDDVIKGTGPEMTKYPRKRNKKLVASLNPIENFKAYPGRPGYSGSLSSVFENQDPEGPGKPFYHQSSERIPFRVPNNLQSGPGSLRVDEEQEPKQSNLKNGVARVEQDNIELSGIGIFGGDDEERIQDKSDVAEDESAEYIDEVSQVKEFGVRNPAFRRPSPPKQEEEKQEQESSFTYRRGRFPPRKIPSPPPKVETTAASVPEEEDEEVEEGDLEIGGDLGADEDDDEETTNPFYKGQRLIPNHVFESPSLPIRQQMGSFEMHMRGGPFVATDKPVFAIDKKKLIVPLEEDLSAVQPAGLPTVDRRPNRPTFHHMGPNPNQRANPKPNLNPQMEKRMDQVNPQMNKRVNPRVISLERPGVPQEQKTTPYRFPAIRPIRPVSSLSPDYPEDNVELPYTDLSHLVHLAKEEVAVLREIARNISASGKEVNLWEVMNAVNATIRDNPNSPVAGLVRRFYQTYMDNAAETTVTPAPERGVYESSLSSLIFLSFGIFLLNSVNDLKAKREGRDRNFSENQVSQSLRALMSDRPEILQLFSHDEGRRLGEPAGQSNTVNNYLRLLMNLMKVYSRSDSEEVDCVWTAYCHQLNLQAAPGGMSSTVARINSVGLKLALQQLPSSEAFPSVLKSLLMWEDLPCATMFPECKTNLIETTTPTTSDYDQ